MIINRASFIATETEADGTQRGTVEATLRGKTQRVRATFMPKYNWLFAYDMTGRYQTGSKAWPASVRNSINERGEEFETVSFGRDDRAPKFRKENCIFFAA